MSKKKTRKEKIQEQLLTGKPQTKKASKKKVQASIPKKNWNFKLLGPAFIAIILTAIVFANSLNNEFVNWDDDRNFYENQNITSLTKGNFWANTKNIFTSPVIGNYNPLTIWTFLLDQKFHGLDNPFNWHLENLLLHLFCVFMIYLLCVKLNLSWQGSLVVALLFGIHPLRVESVAWVTERKDVLYGAFYLVALYYYTKSIHDKKRYLIPIILCFVLSLLSKIQAVVLPLSMLAVDYYLTKEVSLKNIWSKWHYFALSLAGGILGIVLLKDQGSLESNTTYPIWQRLFIGTYSYGVYLVKSIIPYRMSPMYPYPNTFPSLFYPTILIVPAALGFVWWAFKKNLKAVVFGMLFFTFNIMFLLQILGAGQGFIADRFTYIAYFGLFFIFGYYFEKLIASEKLKIPTYGLYGIAFAAFAFLSFNQNKVWQNSGTLWTHVIKYYSNTTLPFGNRANYYRDIGETQKALDDYSTRINLKQDEASPFNSRARLYFNSTKREDWLLSLADYNKAIELDPKNAEYFCNRGAIHAKLNNLNAAIQDFNQGLAIDPTHKVGYLNRSIMYNMQGDIPKALSDIESYLRFDPYNADLWYESGICKRKLNREGDALLDFNKAIQYNAKKGIYYHERAKSLLSAGRKQDARADYYKAESLGFEVDRSIEGYFN